MNRLAASVVFLFSLLTPIVGLAQASEQTLDVDLEARCEFLEDLNIKDTNIMSATIVPGDGDLPEYCRVLGYIRPAINFEIRLPIENWNGKFYMKGCGGYCGKVSISGTDNALKRNYAVSAMDSGHWGEGLFDGRWAYHDLQAEIDWGYRAVHETARVSKAVIEAFYDHAPARSYFQGCSTGGRQAVMEAWRYPDDFDGVISGCPHPKTTGTAMLGVWLAQVNTGPDGKNLITPADVPLIRDAVYDACDHLDGLEDGLISDPRDCQFDPATLACEGVETDNCLTASQVEALIKMYDGPRDSDGRQLYAGLPLGSEPYWGRWVIGKTAEGSDDFSLRHGIQFMRYMAFLEDPGQQYTASDFDFDSDPQRMEHMAQIYDVDYPDLDAFRESGGKLLMWHSWADAAPPPMETIAYYESVEEHVGNRYRTQEFFRLFMVPGMDHCGIGEGPGISGTGFDPLTALENWVEKGEPPWSILTTKYDEDGNILWTRPVCPFPKRAIYKGFGDVNDAANYSCGEP